MVTDALETEGHSEAEPGAGAAGRDGGAPTVRRPAPALLQGRELHLLPSISSQGLKLSCSIGLRKLTADEIWSIVCERVLEGTAKP